MTINTQKEARHKTDNSEQKNISSRLNKINLDEKKISLRAYKLWQESSEYHESQYYWDQAKHQIEIERRSIDIYNWYDPRKWINLIEHKWLKSCSRQLKKCSVLDILGQLAILSVLIGVITFLTEAEKRHDEIIMETRKNLAEVTELQTPRHLLISSYLQRLNRRDFTFAQLFTISGALELAQRTWNRETIYVSSIEKVNGLKQGTCKKILDIQLILPRWSKASLVDLRIPEGTNLSRIELCDAKLPQATLNKVNLNNAKLAGASLFQAKLENTQLTNSDLRESSLVFADLKGANLTSADLTGADLTGANLIGANLTGADLKSTDLTGTNLTDADLKSTDLTGTNLRKIKINSNSPLKLACNWDKAFYIYREVSNNVSDKKWELDKEANRQYIEDLKQDKASDPQTPVDCSMWN